ncbi:unnamed protein product [Gongylonema pulchrum]|uniref:RNA helicase n=1 Tax=Gongylonema pulchrum TaxID=637853 RepID=A0A183CXV2_9BILA|nr:unnamed protein product [Gongylonema pulchrum]
MNGPHFRSKLDAVARNCLLFVDCEILIDWLWLSAALRESYVENTEEINERRKPFLLYMKEDKLLIRHQLVSRRKKERFSLWLENRLRDIETEQQVLEPA